MLALDFQALLWERKAQIQKSVRSDENCVFFVTTGDEKFSEIILKAMHRENYSDYLFNHLHKFAYFFFI